MTGRSKNCSRRWSRDGLTLIEVVAAIAILGTILVGVVMSKSRHTRQLALAGRQMKAVRAADELISAWWAADRSVPINESGVANEDESLVWDTRVVENDPVGKLGARVVRVAIRPSRHMGPGPGGGEDALVTVDLVLPHRPAGPRCPTRSAGHDPGRARP